MDQPSPYQPRTMKSDLERARAFHAPAPPPAPRPQPIPAPKPLPPGPAVHRPQSNQSSSTNYVTKPLASPFLEAIHEDQAHYSIAPKSRSIQPPAPVHPTQPAYQKNSIPNYPHVADPAASFFAPPLNPQAPAAKSPRHSWLVALIFLIIIGLLGTGGYYYWKSQSIQKTLTLQSTSTPSSTLAPTKPTSPTPSANDFSLTKPNYLSFATETITPQEINHKFKETAGKVLAMNGASQPIEFVLTDANNNPLAFSIFSLLTKINLPPEVLENLDDNFSLFFFKQPNSNRVRTALAVTLKNREALISSIRLAESELPKDLTPLFLDTVANPVGEFKDGTYQGIPIRYLNLNTPEELSIDYTVSSSFLLVGTSKDTLRSLIDLNK